MLGTTLHSHYKIVKLLGTGRSGAAYLAEDVDLPTYPPCLVKKFKHVDDNSIERLVIQQLFELQTTIFSQVGQHPQIPTLIAKFEEDDDRYLVREYIDGESLSKELAPGFRWNQVQTFDFLMDLMGILSFVHSFGYIHQEIDPENIIRRSLDGRFSLIGFGAVKDLGRIWQKRPNRHQLQVPMSIGSPGYIPYEQEQNAAQFNSDIYAVGVIAIQALTGKFPIDRDPRSFELKWRDGVKIDLRMLEIVDKMVRPDYRDRYQSVLEVLTDLQSFALTQIPPSKSGKLKPHVIFGAATCALLLGFGAVKLTSKSVQKPQLTPTVAITSSPRATVTPIMANNSGNTIWQTYVDAPTGIKLKYYSTWHLKDIHNLVTGENAIFTSPNQSSIDKYRENVSIRVENLTNQQTTLAEYTKSAIAEITKYHKNAKIVESSAITLAKKPANLVVYTGKDENDMPIKNLEVWTLDRGKAYIMTYKSEPKQYYAFLQTVMTMINSFEIVDRS
jgi:eukaryotic-like serine/threonine-protein kinase